MDVDNEGRTYCFDCFDLTSRGCNDMCPTGYVKSWECNVLLGLDTDVRKEEEVPVFNLLYNPAVHNANEIVTLFMLIKKCWFELEEDALSDYREKMLPDSSYDDMRSQICNGLHLLRRKLDYLPNDDAITKIYSDQVDYFVDVVSDFSNFTDVMLCKSLPTKHGYNIDRVCYNYFHTYMDIRWMLLTFLSKIGAHDCVETHLNNLIHDLIEFALLNYAPTQRSGPTDCFPCPCVEELWLLVQVFIQRCTHSRIDSFWTYFNKHLLVCGENIRNRPVRAKFFVRLINGVADLQNYDEFGNYCTKRSHRIEPNVRILVDAFKDLLTFGASDNEVNDCLNSVVRLVSEHWRSDVTLEFYQLFWEYFWKKLHKDLTKPCPSTVRDLGKYVRLITRDFPAEDVLTGYELFLSLFCNYFKRGSSLTTWNRFKGRIYSRLSAEKVNELTDKSLFNLMFLFLCINDVAPSSDICQRLTAIIKDLTPSRQQTVLVWKIYISFITTSMQDAPINPNLGELVDAFLSVVLAASSNRSQGNTMHLIVEGIQSVVCTDTVHCLVGSWIKHYTSWCNKQNLCYFLDVIANLCRKEWNDEGRIAWLNNCRVHILPCLKTITSSNVHAPRQVGDVAALILTKYCTTDLSQYLSHFIGDKSSSSASLQFLTTLLEGDNVHRFFNNDKLQFDVIRCWLKGCVLNDDNAVVLHRYVVKLSAMDAFVDSSGSSDAFLSLVHSISTRAATADPENVAKLRLWCEKAFANFHLWMGAILKDKDLDEIHVGRIYLCMSALFCRCSFLLYVRARTTSPFGPLVSALLLPIELLTGKRPHNVVLDSIKSTLHLFIRGIGRLNYDQDPYLDRILRDLVVRYVPYLNNHDSPILRCLEGDLGLVLMNKLAVMIKQSKNDLVALQKALSLVAHFVGDRNVSSEGLQIFVKSLLPIVMEQIMFCEKETPVKKCATDIVTNLAATKQYADVRADVNNCLIKFTEQHLAFNSRLYFPFVTLVLAKILPNEVKALIPSLMDNISKVELLRGVGYDNNLRTGLNNVQESVQL